MNEEKFTKDILDALDQAKKVKPSNELIERMENFAVKNFPNKSKFSTFSTLMMAASFIGLLCINALLIYQVNNANASKQTDTKFNYQLTPYNSIYDE